MTVTGVNDDDNPSDQRDVEIENSGSGFSVSDSQTVRVTVIDDDDPNQALELAPIADVTRSQVSGQFTV